MAHTKALADASTEIHCSILADVSINSPKMYLESVLMNSAVEKSEKMLSRSRKVADRVENGTGPYSFARPFV